jgi:hypothetical protein
MQIWSLVSAQVRRPASCRGAILKAADLYKCMPLPRRVPRSAPLGNPPDFPIFIEHGRSALQVNQGLLQAAS